MAKTRQMTAEEVGLVHNTTQHLPAVNTGVIEFKGLTKLDYDVLSDQPAVLDHAKASQYIDLPIFPGEREVRDSQVQLLYDEMRKGNFNELLVILATAQLGDTIYKINGQHTCWAVCFMPESFKLNVREIKFRVKNREQLKMLYATFDRLLARSDGHLMKVHLTDTKSAEGLYASLLHPLSAAVKFWYFDLESERRRMAPEQMTAIIEKELSPLFNVVGHFVQEHHNEAMARRIPLMAAMFATFNKIASKAPDFWVPVMTGLKLDVKSDPRWRLRDFILNSTTGKSVAGQRVTNNEEIYRVALSCWNKWRAGETLSVAPRAPKDRPKPK